MYVKGGTGKNIVGTAFSEVRPTQEFVNPEKVAEYAKKLQAGEKVSPVEIVDIEGKGKCLTEGHHRYVASQQTGIPVDEVGKKGSGPVGLPDWLEVTWKKYIDEDQFWGD